MKKWIVGLIMGLLLFSTPVLADLKITKVWDTGGDYYNANAMVTYKNTSTTTYRNVTIKCYALDGNDNVVGTNQRSFWSREVGPITPGFVDSVKVPVSTHGSHFTSMSCRVYEQ